MNKQATKKKLTDWDWTTLVAAWRYYEHRNTITGKYTCTSYQKKGTTSVDAGKEDENE